MEIITGLFEADHVDAAMRRLTKNGFGYDDMSIMSSAAEMPQFLEGEPEESAVTGAGAGAVVGAAIGALGSAATSTIPGFESMFVAGLLTTTVGGVVGGYLGSLYSVRAETQEEINIHQELEDGRILLLLQTDVVRAETAVSLMEQSSGQHIETHTLSADELDNNQAH